MQQNLTQSWKGFLFGWNALQESIKHSIMDSVDDQSNHLYGWFDACKIEAHRIYVYRTGAHHICALELVYVKYYTLKRRFRKTILEFIWWPNGGPKRLSIPKRRRLLTSSPHPDSFSGHLRGNIKMGMSRSTRTGRTTPSVIAIIRTAWSSTLIFLFDILN